MEYCQWVFHLPLNACTRHGQSSFTHLTSYLRLSHITTLNSFLRDIDHSLTASLTASMVGYLDPCTTSFSLYSHSGHLTSCTIWLPKPCFVHSAGTGSASSSSLCICSTIMGILSPSSACPCGSISVTCTSSFCSSSSSPSACSSICALRVPSFASAAAATCGFS